MGRGGGHRPFPELPAGVEAIDATALG